MRAVFVKLDCLLDGSGPPEGQLKPEAIEAMQLLAESGLLTIVIAPRSRGGPAGTPKPLEEGIAQRIVEQISAGRGGTFIALHCPHRPGEGCSCWGPEPGLLHEAAARFDLKVSESYLICDALADVALAYAVGCRPFLILAGRTIDELYGGKEPRYKDFPITRDLKKAIEYVLHEEEMARALGPFPKAAPLPEEWIGRMIRPLSVKRVGQWLLVLILGGLWLSLGIAYFFIHLYRIQPFPWQAWYITLQFIPRPLRGLLFLTGGAIVAVIALRRLASLIGANSASRERHDIRDDIDRTASHS
ncbi:MAG: HAD hydrolase-like protein [Dehalococcoidia bacterium]